MVTPALMVDQALAIVAGLVQIQIQIQILGRVEAPEGWKSHLGEGGETTTILIRSEYEIEVPDSPTLASGHQW